MKKVLLLLILIYGVSFTSVAQSIDLVGKWSGSEGSKVDFITFDLEGYATFESQGVIMGGKEFVVNGTKGKMTYELNLDKTPLEIDFTITKIDSGDSMKLLAIAELSDANTMNIAIAFDKVRPLEMNSANSLSLIRVSQ